MYVVTPRGPMHTMVGRDIERCMDYANQRAPQRGRAWLVAFHHYARELGYDASEFAVCACPAAPHRPECALLRPGQLTVPVWPYSDDPAHPHDGIVLPDGTGEPPSGVDPWH